MPVWQECIRMQAARAEVSLPRKSNLLRFPVMVAAPNPIPSRPPVQTAPMQAATAPTGPNWEKIGSFAQWAAIMGAMVLGGVSSYLTIHYKNSESQSKSSDDHVSTL